MTSGSFKCVLCGSCFKLHHDGPGASTSTVWIRQFRILYCSRDHIAVSGVGRYSGSLWTPPLDFSRRWSEPGVACLAIGVLEQRPIDGRHGFPFHETCWSLLEKVYSPEPVPSEALYEVCRSLPILGGYSCLDWGHAYGGLYPVDSKGYSRLFDFEPDQRLFTAATYDPCEATKTDPLPLEDFKSPPAICHPKPPRSAAADCLSTLPLEIRIMIASQLLTVDVINARLASRSFWPIFCCQQFWASRFIPTDAERSWAFEAREWDLGLDWRWLYRLTNKSHRSASMENRKRVWRLAQLVREAVGLQWTKPPVLDSPDPNQADFRWREAACLLMTEAENTSRHHRRPSFLHHRGGRSFYEQQTSLPSKLCQMAISTVKLGYAEYISGIRLIPVRGESIQLGYKTNRRETILDVSSIFGFNLAVGEQGITAIQCILDGNRTLQWVGSPHKEPITRRLAEPGLITHIKAGFDGCKMVTLAISNYPFICNSAESRQSLRELAYWHPQIPDTSLEINEASFTAKDTSITRYQPLYWTQFGGPEGQYLDRISGISVYHDLAICAIEFNYHTEDVPVSSSRIVGWRPLDGLATITHFPIDGRRGEHIEAIEVCRLPGYQNKVLFEEGGILGSINILTNHGRSCYIRSERSRMAGVEPIVVVQKATVTGLYWCQNKQGITDIGAVSMDPEDYMNKLYFLVRRSR
ncbi:F-box domain-containing protein [Xylariaceae sp. FL0594]|nr:F-box domain-containing protein [Xylariaceae sp. FL0594]